MTEMGTQVCGSVSHFELKTYKDDIYRGRISML